MAGVRKGVREDQEYFTIKNRTGKTPGTQLVDYLSYYKGIFYDTKKYRGKEHGLIK